MKLLMESWRKFLNEVSNVPGGVSMPSGRPSSRCPQGQQEIGAPSEHGEPRCVEVEPLTERMEFGENFEQWLHGEPTEDDLESDVNDQWFGRAPFCEPQSIDPDCLKKYGFRKIGEGSFRQVWALPDNPNYVMKTATGNFQDSKTQTEMNKAEADALVQTGYPELVPKVYDTADDYEWIVVEKVKPYSLRDDSWVGDFFPELVIKNIPRRVAKQIHTQYRGDPTRLFQDYLMMRRDRLKEGSQSPDPAFKSRERDIWVTNVDEFGGEEAVRELDIRVDQNPLFTKLLDLVTEQELGIWDIRGGNVGKGADGRFVLLDLGYGMETGPKGKPVLPEPRKYSR